MRVDEFLEPLTKGISPDVLAADCINTRISDKITRHMIDTGLSEDELADKLKASREVLESYMNCDYQLHRLELIKLYAALRDIVLTSSVASLKN